MEEKMVGKMIGKKEIISRVKEAYKEGREWCKGNYGRYYRLKINLENGSIWCDCFLSENDWSEYHSETIVSLEYLPGYASEEEANYIEDAVIRFKAAGWEIKES